LTPVFFRKCSGSSFQFQHIPIGACWVKEKFSPIFASLLSEKFWDPGRLVPEKDAALRRWKPRGRWPVLRGWIEMLLKPFVGLGEAQ
jgi:hypothetical protein